MKKKLFLICLTLCISFHFLSAQVFFNEDFNGIPGPTAGGAGTYSFPTGWLLRNVDNRTPDAGVNYVNEAWERREDFINNAADSCAFSTSWYNPAGVANDFMWTPPIAISGNSLILSWRALAPDGAFPDGYEVRIMTVAPTGGTGVIGNQITNSTVLFSIAAENPTWTTRQVSLNAYSGQTVYIGFRNMSNDQFLLMIDDVKVENLPNFDANVTDADDYEYTILPISQATTIPYPSATVQNSGVLALTNVKLNVQIYNSSNALIASAVSAPLDTLNSLATNVFSIPSTWSAPAPDFYVFRYFATMNETDQLITNDTLIKELLVSDSTFARDNSVVSSSLGIGAGNGGFLGQAFTLTQQAYLTSIEAYYTEGYLNRQHAAVIWNTDVTGKPTTILAQTDTLIYPDNNALFVNYPIYQGPMLLAPNTYVVTAIEFDSTLALGTTQEIFTPGKIWVNWPTIPTGDWTNVEVFGAAFSRPFVLRMNLSETLPLSIEFSSFEVKNVNDKYVGLNWTTATEVNNDYFTIERSQDRINFEPIGKVLGVGHSQSSKSYEYQDLNPWVGLSYYRLKQTDRHGDFTYSDVRAVVFNNKGEFFAYPNPTTETIWVTFENSENNQTTYQILNQLGQIVKQGVLGTGTQHEISLKTLPDGIYFIQIQADQQADRITRIVKGE